MNQEHEVSDSELHADTDPREQTRHKVNNVHVRAVTYSHILKAA